MSMSEWDFAVVVTKWLTYISVSCAIGGVSNLLLMRKQPCLLSGLYRYSVLASLVGLVSVSVNFLMQVGSWSENGLAGVVDPQMFSMLWHSSVGDSSFLRILGFFIMVTTALAQRLPLLLRMLGFGAGTLFIGLSFSLTGHTVESGVLTRILLSVHVVLMAWWMGALYPLWLVCRRLSVVITRQELRRFGEVAAFVVVLLLVCGLLLSYQLTTWEQLVSGEYGFWLMIKVSVVCIILVIAALHKWKMVPALAVTGNALYLSRSVLIEMLIGLTILFITAILSALVGPVH